MKYIKSPQKRHLLEELKEIYGLTSLPYLLIEGGKKKIRAFSGNLTKEEISKLREITRVEVIGMYLISQKDAQPRLSFDSLNLLKDQITKNIIEIDKQQFQQWIRGHDLEFKTQRGTIVLKYQDDLVGVGKSNGEKIFNYVPKERKLKK